LINEQPEKIQAGMGLEAMTSAIPVQSSQDSNPILAEFFQVVSLSTAFF